MRIGFDVSPLFRSHSAGVERATRELALALERRGRIELVRLAPPPGMGLLRWRQLELARAPARLGLAGLHSPVSALPWFARVPRIQTVHELPWRHGERENADGRHRFWARRGPLRAAAVIVPTELVARDLLSECPSAAGRVHVIPWAASASFAPRPAGSSSAARPFVLCPGGARPKKGAEAAVQALEQLAREQRLELELVLTGASATELAQPARPRVRLFGMLADAELAALYREARAVLVLARSEGFGLPVIEALACGTPVIVRRASAQAEVAGEAGVEVEPENAAELARAILRAHEQRESLRAPALRRAAQFSWDASAEKLERLWQELVR